MRKGKRRAWLLSGQKRAPLWGPKNPPLEPSSEIMRARAEAWKRSAGWWNQPPVKTQAQKDREVASRLQEIESELTFWGPPPTPDETAAMSETIDRLCLEWDRQLARLAKESGVPIGRLRERFMYYQALCMIGCDQNDRARKAVLATGRRVLRDIGREIAGLEG